MFGYLLIAYAIEIPLLIVAIRRSGFMPFPHGFMLYLIFGQLFMWLNAEEILVYRFIASYSSFVFVDRFPEVLAFYVTFFLAAWTMVPRQHLTVRLTDLVRMIDVSFTSQVVLAIFLWLRLIFQLSLMDWDLLWYNNAYLTISSIEAFNSNNPLTQIISSTQRVFAIITFVFFAYAVAKKNAAIALFLLPLVVWHFLFELAGSSRYTVLGLLVMAITFWFFGSRKLSVFIGVFSVPTLFSVLGGRITDRFGFSTLGYYFQNITVDTISDSLAELTNIFEGMFVTAEYLRGSLSFSPIYKILSLSPLISAMDGFSDIQAREEIRLTYYVPNSAITEVLSFGLVYALIYFGTQFYAGVMTSRLLINRPSLISLFLSSLVLIGAYLQFTYSARTVFRFFFIAAIVSSYLQFWGSRNALPVQDADGTAAKQPG